jgi:ribulose-phosphate 3-epimerase
MSKRIKVSPSILAADLTNIAAEIEKLADAGADFIHLDVMDGHYVPNLTFGMPIIKRIAQLSDLPLDTHLMVMNPEDYLDDLAEIGVKYLSYHPETVIHNHRFIHAIKEKKIKAGWAINPGVSENILEPVIADLDFVLLMSVNPGFSGQKFIPNVYDKIRHVRSMASVNDSLEIEVDGGVNNENAPELARCGANILVAGAYILGAEDYSERIRSLRNVE